jgi:CheY-like chemotaxis protein
VRALIVDDNATNRQILEHYLQSWGLAHDSTDDARQALTLLRTAASGPSPHSIVILDANMPGVDGYELARLIKSDPLIANVPIIMLSSGGMPDDPDQRRGIEQILIKPARQSLLYDAIVQALCDRMPSRLAPTVGSRQRRQLAGRVLLVEDNKVNQRVAAGLLRRFGISPDIASNGVEALRAIEVTRYDMVFMDCQMPEMDGLTATREIRARDPQRRTPIIAMTAHALSGYRETCLAAGMDDYVPKPVRLSDLGQAIARTAAKALT